jgi:hypothetical protein
MDRKISSLLSVEEDVSIIGANEPNGHIEGGCFSGSIGAKKANYFSFTNFKGEVIHDGLAVVSFSEIFCF